MENDFRWCKKVESDNSWCISIGFGVLQRNRIESGFFDSYYELWDCFFEIKDNELR